jgi:hypothetical protein
MRLRFSIRDLLWLTLVVALAVGWWLDHVKLASQIPEDYGFEIVLKDGQLYVPTVNSPTK